MVGFGFAPLCAPLPAPFSDLLPYSGPNGSSWHGGTWGRAPVQLPRGHWGPPDGLTLHRMTEYPAMAQLRRYRLPRGRGKQPKTRAVPGGAAPRASTVPTGPRRADPGPRLLLTPRGPATPALAVRTQKHHPEAEQPKASSAPLRPPREPRPPNTGQARPRHHSSQHAAPGTGHRQQWSGAQSAPLHCLAKSLHKTCRQLAQSKHHTARASSSTHAPGNNPTR